jgi:hypothetical protein
VVGSRTALILMAIAGGAMLGLGVAALLLVDPPEVDGWLRGAFGTVFGTMAVAMAAILGIPSLIGLWAMADANADDAAPALSPTTRRLVAIAAVAAVVGSALAMLLSGRGASILDLVLTGLVALLTLGLAGAAAFSPHRGRALLSAAALVLAIAVIVWVFVRAWSATP